VHVAAAPAKAKATKKTRSTRVASVAPNGKRLR
jgi:hypothetical protein